MSLRMLVFVWSECSQVILDVHYVTIFHHNVSSSAVLPGPVCSSLWVQTYIYCLVLFIKGALIRCWEFSYRYINKQVQFRAACPRMLKGLILENVLHVEICNETGGHQSSSLPAPTPGQQRYPPGAALPRWVALVWSPGSWLGPLGPPRREGGRFCSCFRCCQ